MYSNFNTRRVHVLNSYIFYTDTRAGEHTVIFLHGSLTNSYIWRKVIPHVQGFARCLVPDLLGIGISGKTDHEEYGFERQYRYLCAWLKSIGIEKDLVFIGHEWGAALAARWMYEHPELTKGYIHIEGIIGTFNSILDINSTPFQELVKLAKSPAASNYTDSELLEIKEKLKLLIQNISLDELSFTGEQPLANTQENINAILAYFREIPIENESATISDISLMLKEINLWLSRTTNLPKLFLNCNLGLFSPWVSQMTSKWPNQTEMTLKAKHFPQESCPESVGKAITNFLRGFQVRNYRKY